MSPFDRKAHMHAYNKRRREEHLRLWWWRRAATRVEPDANALTFRTLDHQSSFGLDAKPFPLRQVAGRRGR